jgi:MoaE-MoaD fusion protein
MASAELERIAADAVARHGLCAAAVEHRTGTVALSEASVLIAVSAPHRAEAFAGGREIIDAIKERAPIWKKEEGEWAAGFTPARRRPNR